MYVILFFYVRYTILCTLCYSSMYVILFFYAICFDNVLEGKLAMDLIVGQEISRYFLRKATYNLKFGGYSL